MLGTSTWYEFGCVGVGRDVATPTSAGLYMYVLYVRTLVVDLICFLFLDQLDTNADEDGCVEENKSS